MKKTLALASILVAATAALPLSGADWPGWMGPNRNGWVADFQPPESWPQNLRQVWQVTVGTGYSSPIVSAQGKVFQQARQNDEEVLWCLDFKTGAVIWRNSHPVPFTPGLSGESHGKGPKSSPMLADGRVFTLSIINTLSAHDAASGDVLWRRHYNHLSQPPHPYWGASTSPLVVGDRVMVHFGGDDRGALVALDVKTGQEIWNQGPSAASYSSPLFVEIDGVRQIVEWNFDALVGLNPETGSPLWSYPFPYDGTDQNIPTPVFHQDVILVGRENRGVRRVEPKRTDTGWSATEIWRQRRVALDMSTAVMNDGLLYGFSHYGRGRIFCLDPQDGKIIWQGPYRTAENVAFLSVKGFILALLDSGELQVIPATAAGHKVVASYTVADSPTWAPPVLLNDHFLIKDRNTLTLWSLSPAKNVDP